MTKKSSDSKQNVDGDGGMTYEKIEASRRIVSAAARLERVIFNSEPMKITYSQIRIPLFIREPGCWFSECYGEGKTTAANYCVAALKKEIPSLPVYLINEYVLPSNELKSFFLKALSESGYALADCTYIVKIRNRLSSYWAELSEQSPLRCVVLIIDEGQALRATDLYVLRDLGNDIAAKNGSLQTFIFGESPKLDCLVSKFSRLSGDESAGGAYDRILGGHKLKIHGYSGLNEWRSLFIDMDKRILPELGNQTVRESFFSHLDSSNFCFEREAERFYGALGQINRGKLGNFNLRRIFVGIRFAIMSAALESLNGGAKSFQKIDEADWFTALQYANTLK